MISTYIPRSGSIVGVITGCLLVAAPPAVAKPSGSCPNSKQRLCGQDVTVTSSVRRAEPDACYAGRRKLWVEGQGWIVRRVTTCDPGSPSGK
jgi:hypothetical protein